MNWFNYTIRQLIPISRALIEKLMVAKVV